LWVHPSVHPLLRFSTLWMDGWCPGGRMDADAKAEDSASTCLRRRSRRIHFDIFECGRPLLCLDKVLADGVPALNYVICQDEVLRAASTLWSAGTPST
jgi:hypothetical protein